MFEHLASKLFRVFLSKYFTEESLARNKSSTSAQLGVWSGYISLENLELKNDVINQKLRRKGSPFEILHCTFRRVEITVPWSKLRLSMSKNLSADRDQRVDAVVVIVVDGVHLLARTNFEFDDAALQDEAISQRRQALAEASSFGKVSTPSGDGYWIGSYAEMIKRRIKEGILQQIVDTLHVHIRDLHIRLEDLESDTENPFAVGITMESMHIQHSSDSQTRDQAMSQSEMSYVIEPANDDCMIHKVAQLNHLSVYMNALGYGGGLAPEHSILQHVYVKSPERLSRALDLCIARRASVMASPSRHPYIPQHAYLVLPIDGTMEMSLSTIPNNLDDQPALVVNVSIDDISVHVRDFQSSQLVRLLSVVKNHCFTKKYRAHRPSVPVKENPRLWWQYANKAILLQLKDNHLRWSWSRFEQRFQLRDRYVALYERKLRYQSKEQAETAARNVSRAKTNQDKGMSYLSTENGGSSNPVSPQKLIEELEIVEGTPDEGAGPSVQIIENKTGALTPSELNELQDMEDGRKGDLSISDLILFRIVANMRLGRFSTSNGQGFKRSWWRNTVENVAGDDSDAQEELQRLLSYLDRPLDDDCDDDCARRKSQTAIILSVNLERACVVLFAPLRSTADQTQQLRRLHERFLDIVVDDLRLGLTLKGDYQSAIYQCSLQDANASEIRVDRSRHVIASRAPVKGSADDLDIDNLVGKIDPLLVLCLSTNAPKNDECDLELVVFLDVIDVVLVPDCQWITHVKQLLQNISSLPQFARYWGNLTLAYINSVASGRLSFLAKTETAGFEHKNMDVDITIQCPVLRIGDVDGSFLEINLGIAHVKTEKLAGIASTKLGGDQALREIEIERLNTSGYLLDSIEEASSAIETASSPSRFSQRPLLARKVPPEKSGVLSSSWSIDSRNRYRRAAPSVSGSMTFDDMTFKRYDPSRMSSSIGNTRATDAMFYDLYRFQLTTGRIKFVSKADSKEVSPGFEVMTTIQTSVIPADHTLSRFRSHSVVGSLSLSLSLSTILQFAHTIETWKSVYNREPPAQVFNAVNDIEKMIVPTQGPISTIVTDDEVGEGPESEVDENEFFDAHDGNNSIMGDSNEMFDHWIADAESVISRPTPDRRGRSRQSSISDVSSASDQSMRRRTGQGYLSAENLAKLDEAAAEDDDISESLGDTDNDTFHSALTAGGQADLARELDEDIQKAEANVLRLKTELEKTKISLGGLPSTEASNDRRKARRSLKLSLERSIAEMQALRALQLDLESSVTGESGGKETHKDLESRRSASVSADARSFLNAKKKLGGLLIDDSHNLTANLNRQLFQASITFNELTVTVKLNCDEERESSLGAVPQIFEVSASQTGLAVFHSVSDTKAYFTVDSISACGKLGGINDVHNLPQFPLIGGTNDQLMEMQLPHHLPQHIASSMEEKFVRLSFHTGNRRREGSPAEIVKLRVVFGDVEVTPHKRSLISLLSFYEAVARHTRPSNPPDSRKAPASSLGLLQKVAPNIDENIASNKAHKYYDLAVRLSSIRVALSCEDHVVGALAIAETTLRCVHCPAPVAFKSRSQLDFKCANFQVLSISSLRDGKGTECFGRSDPYGHLIVFRLRRQLVPALEQGGWVVGAENTIRSDGSVAGPVAWNVHVGVRINPFTVIVTPTDLSRCSDGIRESMCIIARKKSVPLAAAHTKVDPSVGALLRPSTRWRLDVIQQRSSLILARYKPSPDELSLELILSWSLLTSIEEVGSSKKYYMVRIGIVDMSLARHSDEWPLLEQFSVLSRLQVATSGTQGGRPLERATLKLPPDSLWNEISALMHRNEWDALPEKPVEDNYFSIKVTPVRINVCVPVCVTLSSSLHPFYALIRDNRDNAANEVLANDTVGVGFQVSMMALEARLLRETDNRPISFAEPLASFSTIGVTFEYSQGERISAKVVIEKSALYDLSVRPGVLVLGEDPSPRHSNKTSFVRAELQLEHPISEARTMRVAVDWGRIQCLVVPSLLRHLLAFRENLSRQFEKGDGQISKHKKLGAPSEASSFKGDLNILVSARAEAFELLVASRNVAAYVHEQAKPMGAVAFRWSASLNAAFAGASTISGLKCLDPDSSFADAPDRSLFKEFVDRYLGQSSGFLAASDDVGLSLGSAFTGCIKVKVTGFQAIRTNIESRKGQSRRLSFLVVPPVAGERRITNSIDCEVKHRVSGAIMCATHDGHARIECSHLLQLESNFLDVLAYISQSNTGVTEAFKVNVKPIVEMLKRKEEHQPRNSEGVTQVSSSSFVDVLQRGSLVCSVRIQGFGITCVPGGATRLTESPIIKLELSNLSLGFAACPVPKDTKPLDSNFFHLTMAGWLTCELKADYHNRRLVGWEPIVEPWMWDTRFSFDITEALHLHPLEEIDDLNSPASSSIRLAYGVVNSDRRTERANDALSRLWPFTRSSTAAATKPLHEAKEEGDFLSHHDFCYLMLASATRGTVSLALHHSKQNCVFTNLPGHRPLDWLSAFGYPQTSDGRKSVAQQSILVTDRQMPLNVNCTGAFIENVVPHIMSFFVRSNGDQRAVAPHWIRNQSGMTIRFQEVLDVDRDGEVAQKITMAQNESRPLTLERSVSQSCDPHRAFIKLELGSFEDTVGRIDHDEMDVSKGTRSSTFSYKAVARIGVDTVGVFRYPLDRNIEKAQAKDSRALGWIIVRVELKGSLKLVSVESPFVLKSNANSDLLCEIRDHNGLSLLWRCLIPKSGGGSSEAKAQGLVSVPVDIVPFIHDESYAFSVAAVSHSHDSESEAELIPVGKGQDVLTPPPFSPSSLTKGLIGESELALTPIFQNKSISHRKQTDKVHISVCSVRIGSFEGVKSLADSPEQRMIFFRSPLTIRNYLAYPILVQVRVKAPIRGVKRTDSSAPWDTRVPLNPISWKELGILECGQHINWTGSFSTDKIEVRVRFVEKGETSSRFPSWSSAVVIEKNQRGNTRAGGNKVVSQMRVLDTENLPLDVSVVVEGTSDNSTGHDSIRECAEEFPPAVRVVSFFVPFWIVDGTNEDLEFYSGARVAGQTMSSSIVGLSGYPDPSKKCPTMGLAELLEDDKLLHLPSRSKFDVTMIGHKKSLTVRRRSSRLRATGKLSPWSHPIPLHTQTVLHDITVYSEESSLMETVHRNESESLRYLFRASIVPAPDRFGGKLGTRLIHIRNRFSVLNEMGRDIEIECGDSPPAVVRASASPRPFHFDVSSPMRFRLKEFGSNWSGSFTITKNRREITLRLRHTMKSDDTIIATIAFHAQKKSANPNLIVFRMEHRPPFRLENHTMHPLLFGQCTRMGLLGSEDSSLDSMLLPFQNQNFAWDEPEMRRRLLVVKVAGSADLPIPLDSLLGRFFLDRIAPGTDLKLDSSKFKGEVVADGPTRVLRVSDASIPKLTSFRQDERNYFHQKPESFHGASMSIIFKLSHGFGISFVDWEPQELVYARLNDIQLERKVDTQSKELVTISIGKIKLNNQLWVTPYPVMLTMGRRPDSHGRRRNRRGNAISLKIHRSLKTHGGLGNLTLLDVVDVSTEPAFFSVDGNVAHLLVRMARQALETTVEDGHSSTDTLSSRDSELRRVLDIENDGDIALDQDAVPSAGSGALHWGTNSDFMLTAALAARSRILGMIPAAAARKVQNAAPLPRRKDRFASLSGPPHKYYVGSLRIAPVKADLSWSGLSLPGVYSLALAFEGLPVRLRQFVSSHAYGTAEEHVQSLKAHYFSIFRVFDVLLGLSLNPTFLIRAVVYTCRQSLATMLDSWSGALEASSKRILQILPKKRNEFQPTYDDGLPFQPSLPKSLFFPRLVVGPFLTLTSTFLRGSSIVNSWGSSMLRYGPQTKAGTTRAAHGLVRSRNPRLFENVDGKDLLVEYVEGDNAGKALLSRVRMGMHLGEGYIFHTEGAKQPSTQARSSTPIEASPLILMMTSERVLLLDGKLEQNFCAVVWETVLQLIVHVEVSSPSRLARELDIVVIWYLSSGVHHTKSITSDTKLGTDSLLSKSFFVPQGAGCAFMDILNGKIKSI